FRVKEYRRSFEFIRQKMLEHQPDIIINFYEPLIGLFYFFNDPPIPLVSFAHQYIYNHPGFEFPVRGRIKDKIAIKFYTQLTSLRSKKQFALSFYPINDNVRRSIIGTPPLLRRELFEQKTETRNFILIYLLKGGYREDIIEWHKKNPQVELHCFTDNNQEYDTVMYSANLSFHKLNDKNFLEKMAAAKGLVTTAGFESVCEAMYLGKPIMMVPVQGHFEQFCNARDAAKAGAGIYSDAFHIEMFFDYLSAGKWDHQQFRLWVDSAKDKILQHLDELLQKAEPYNPMVPAF
ncbi:MAG TPA: glycosyltransferase family protein, partial [Bacteroidia bacterium]